MSAHFVGMVKTVWLKNGDDDRDMELIEDFAFIDDSGKEWKAPAGSIINGASIPSGFWSTVGPPYVGDYRRASVVHDVACVVRTEPSEDVHLMFYDAMIADGVGFIKANTMYQAVKRFGPSWGVSGGARAFVADPPVATEEDAKRLVAAVQEAAAEVGENASPQELERALKY